MWLVRWNYPDEVRMQATTAEGTAYDYASLGTATRFAFKLHRMTTKPADLDEEHLLQSWHVRLLGSDDVVPLAEVPVMRPPRNPNMELGSSAKCVALNEYSRPLPRPAVVYVSRSEARPPRSKRPTRPRGEVASASTEVCPYEWRTMGGDLAEVERIMAARPEWDEETVKALFYEGATPRLHSVDAKRERPKFNEYVCTFVHPSGVRVPNILIYESALFRKYPDHAASYR